MMTRYNDDDNMKWLSWMTVAQGVHINVAICQNACSNIGAPMHGPSSDVWTNLRCPYIGALMYGLANNTSDFHLYIGVSIHPSSDVWLPRYPTMGAAVGVFKVGYVY